PVLVCASCICPCPYPLPTRRSSDLIDVGVKTGDVRYIVTHGLAMLGLGAVGLGCALVCQYFAAVCAQGFGRSLRRRLFSRVMALDRKSTRLNSSHVSISYAVFFLKK